MTVQEAILYLSSKCDGAKQLDGQGFNKHDAQFGHSLARQLRLGRDLTMSQYYAASKMIKKYYKQLHNAKR